jgi:hypothetical protein
MSLDWTSSKGTARFRLAASRWSAAAEGGWARWRAGPRLVGLALAAAPYPGWPRDDSLRRVYCDRSWGAAGRERGGGAAATAIRLAMSWRVCAAVYTSTWACSPASLPPGR